MGSILYAADIVAVLILLYWCIKNDDLAPGKRTVGLFAYREPIGVEQPSAFSRATAPNKFRKP